MGITSVASWCDYEAKTWTWVVFIVEELKCFTFGIFFAIILTNRDIFDWIFLHRTITSSLIRFILIKWSISLPTFPCRFNEFSCFLKAPGPTWFILTITFFIFIFQGFRVETFCFPWASRTSEQKRFTFILHVFITIWSINASINFWRCTWTDIASCGITSTFSLIPLFCPNKAKPSTRAIFIWEKLVCFTSGIFYTIILAWLYTTHSIGLSCAATTSLIPMRIIICPRIRIPNFDSTFTNTFNKYINLISWIITAWFL